MEHQKEMMMICALYGAPHFLGHFPRKKRSQTTRLCRKRCLDFDDRSLPRKKRSETTRLGPKRCLDLDDTFLPPKKRKVMFTETDMASLELNATRNNSPVEEHGKENEMMVQGSQKNEELPLLKGKSFLDKEISTPRKQKGKMAHEEKRVDTVGVVVPKTPSPEKRKRVRGTTKKDEDKILVRVSQKVESAYYYTRTLNNFVVTELERENKLSNQPSTDTSNQQPKAVYHLVDDKMVFVKGLKKKMKRIQFGLYDPGVLKNWRDLLSKSRAESIGSPRNKDNGICREVNFIYKVGYIQGSRVHLPWKGSVLDSVIGALLTQRVGDNSSSSAFMSLGTIFPQYSTCDLYSRHHRIMRVKRSIACSSQQISALEYAVNFINKRENVSKLGKQSKMTGKSMKAKVLKKDKPKPDWNNLREDSIANPESERDADKIDSVDWHAVMRANVDEIAEAILVRGMNKKLALRIKDFLNRLVLHHGNLDLEWLRKVDSQKAKDFLLSIYGIGIKSAECVRLLDLRQPAFPVDINVARVTVRLGWVPAPSISDDIQMYLLYQNSKLHDLIHQYLWSQLCKLDNEILHQLHCHMITFGKVFCTKKKPNCAECPMRSDCRYYSNLADRTPSPVKEIDIEDLGNSRKSMIKAKPAMSIRESERKKCKVKEAPIVVLPDDIIEAPKTPVKVPFSRRQSIASKKGTSLKVTRPSSNMTRTEYIIYELPDWHPILETFDDRDPDDLSPYLLITWETDLEKIGESSAKESPSTSRVQGFRIVPGTIMVLCYVSRLMHPEKLRRQKLCELWRCNDGQKLTASYLFVFPLIVYSSSVMQIEMIPCRTALRGSFPLNATYFQPNEVFADQQTHRIPVDFPRRQLQGLPRKTLYCGTNLTGIVKGRSANEIRRIFHEGYICTRIFDRKTCATRTLDKRLHNPQKRNLKKKDADIDPKELPAVI